MNKKVIKELGEVIGGYTFRGAIKNQSTGDTFVLQAKDVEADVELKEAIYLPKVQMGDKGSKSLLQKNDVVLINRSSNAGNFFAAQFSGNEENVVASISLFIIRIFTDTVLPEYLVNYLNSTKGQSALQNISKGAVVKSVSIKDLRATVIPVPELDVQKAIIGVDVTARKQEQLLSEKIAKIQLIKRAAIAQAIT